MKRIWLVAAAVVVIAVIAGVFYVLSNLNSLVAGIIEREGGKALATDVAVSGVDISLREGRATIAGLTVASPDGYAASPAFSLGEITADIDLESLRDEPIVIDEIRVLAPHVAAEIQQDGSSNIGDLQKNVQQSVAAAGGAGGGDGAAADQKRIRIKRFVFEAGRIEVDASALGLEAKALDLPAIRLDDIGGAEGALPDEIAQAVLGALTRQATAAIAEAGVKEKVRDLVEDEVKEKAGDLLDKFGK